MKEHESFNKLFNEFKDSLKYKEKELQNKEEFLEKYSIQLNEKEEELLNKEKAIQDFLRNEINDHLDNSEFNSFTQIKREPLIKKIIEELLLHQAGEMEETEIKERKFLRNEYKKLKQTLFHEMNEIHFESEDEEDFEIDDYDIEKIKQELKDELEYLEKRHPGNGIRLSNQDLLDFRTFDTPKSNEEKALIESYLELYNKAKVSYDKFVFLTFITGIKN